MDVLKFIDNLNAEQLMARINIPNIYPDLVLPDSYYAQLSERFGWDDDALEYLGIIENYLHINLPVRDTHLNLLLILLSKEFPNSALMWQQWGKRSDEEDRVWEKACNIYTELKLVTTLVTSMRSSYYSYFVDRFSTDVEFAGKLVSPNQPTINVNGDNHNLINIKSIYEKLKGYWMVALLPHEERNLENMHNGISVKWDMCIGEQYEKEYITGPFGTIVFGESQVVPFKRN